MFGLIYKCYDNLEFLRVKILEFDVYDKLSFGGFGFLGLLIDCSQGFIAFGL